VDGDDGVLVVVGIGELEGQLELVELVRQAGQEDVEFGVLEPFVEELAPGGELLGIGAQGVSVSSRRSRSRRFWRMAAFLAGLSQKPASCIWWSISASSRSRSVASKIPPEAVELVCEGLDLLLGLVSDHRGLLRGVNVNVKDTAIKASKVASAGTSQGRRVKGVRVRSPDTRTRRIPSR